MLSVVPRRGLAVMAAVPPLSPPPSDEPPATPLDRLLRTRSTPSLVASDERSASPLDRLQLSDYWHARAVEMSRPSATSLFGALSAKNTLMYENLVPKEGSLVSYAAAEKLKHPDRVLLFRVGDFYEAYGLDALMMVEHSGLNPMGGKARAGCPVVNLQPTLDGLTAAGLTVAV